MEKLSLEIDCVLHLKHTREEKKLKKEINIHPKNLKSVLLMSSVSRADIDVISLSINKRKIDNFNDFLKFSGDNLFIDLKANQEQLLWFPYFYSENKMDFVFNNSYNDYKNDIGRVYVPHVSYRIGWSNQAFPEINKKEFDLGCFGCSITKGHDLPTNTAWPYQYAEKTKESMANFGVGNLSVAGIFMNLKVALQRHKFKKIILLLPTLNRSLFRVQKSGYHLRVPIGWPGHNKLPAGFLRAFSDETVWLTNKDLVNIMKKSRSELMDGSLSRKTKACIRRIKRLLGTEKDLTFYISSWDDECYSYINEVFDKENVIEKFDCQNWERLAEIGDHPHQDLHTEWVNKIIPKTFTK